MQLKNGFHLGTLTAAAAAAASASSRIRESIPQHNNNQPFSNVNLAVTEVLVDQGPHQHNGAMNGGQSNHHHGHEEDQEPSDRVTVYSLYDVGDEGRAEAVVQEVAATVLLNGGGNGIDRHTAQQVLFGDPHHDDHDLQEEEEDQRADPDAGGTRNRRRRRRRRRRTRNGFRALPSENLKFVTNEFGFLELLEEDSSENEGDDSSSYSDEDDENERHHDNEHHEQPQAYIPVSNGNASSPPPSPPPTPPPAESGIVDPSASASGIPTVSCVTCGCYALATEFYDEKHCTYDCAVITRINESKVKEEVGGEGGDDDPVGLVQQKRKRRAAEEDEEGEDPEEKRVKVECIEEEQDDNEDEELGEEEEEIEGEEGIEDDEEDPDSENVEDEEEDELEDEDDADNFVPAPVELFRQPAFPVGDNPFRVNDLLEAIDPEHQSLFCPVTVVEVIGYRLLLKFIGYPDKFNFWVNADSENIFPANWSANYTGPQASCSQPPTPPLLHFHCPPNFTWSSYTTSSTSSRVAPESNFPHINDILDCPVSPVRVGMKLEAVDVRNTDVNLVCVATVTCVMGDRFLVHFDSWDSLYDYWAVIGSPYIHPVGYCKQRGIDITPPHCYEACEFEWDEYLEKTGSVPMPKELFTTAEPVGFLPGHQIEIIDKRSPRLLRRATVGMVTAHTLSVHFNALPSIYDYDVSETSPDIHPVGWGAHTGHPLADSDDDEDDDDERGNQDQYYDNHNDHEYDEEDEENDEDGGKRRGRRNRRIRIQPMNDGNGMFPACPNHKVCKSVCSVKGPAIPFHSKSRDCPFSTANLQVFVEGGGSAGERVVVFEDKYYDLGGGSGNLKVAEDELGHEDEDQEQEVDENQQQNDDEDVEEEEDQENEEEDQDVEEDENVEVDENEDENVEVDENEDQTVEVDENEIDDVDESSDLEVAGGDEEPENPETRLQSSDNVPVPPTTQLPSSCLPADAITGEPSTTQPDNNAGSPACSTTTSLPQEPPPPPSATTIPKRSDLLLWSHDRISSLVQNLCSNLPTAQKVADQFRNNLIDGESFLMLTQSDITDALGIKLGPAVKIYNLIRLIDLNK